MTCGNLYFNKQRRTWPTEHLDDIDVDGKGEESIEVDIKAVGPLHWFRRTGRLQSPQLVSNQPVVERGWGG